MKKTLNRFIESRFFPLAIILIALTIWSYKFYLKDDNLTTYTYLSVFFLSIPFSLLVIFKKDTIYSTMPLLAILFTLGMTGMNIDSVKSSLLGFMSGFLMLGSIIFHLIYYKVKFKLKSLGISLILISISFLIPLLYTPFNEVSLLLSSLGLIYLVVYLFYANTISANQINKLVRYLGFIALLLSLQLFIIWLNGLLKWENGNIIENFLTIFNSSTTDPGWGNINDLTIHLVLSSVVFIFYIEKYPKSFLPWLFLGWIGFWIYVSNARGSMITYTILIGLVALYYTVRGNRDQRINLIKTLLVGLIMIFIFSPIINEIIDKFFNSFYLDDPNKTLTGRIKLWWDHEDSAWNTFLKYPVFGSGWHTKPFILNPSQNRVTIYHSTFFHVLATGGILGIILLGYHWIKVFQIFKKNFHLKISLILLLGLVITQFHGLFDNTQYMIHFSIYTYIMFAVLENTNINENDLLSI